MWNLPFIFSLILVLTLAIISVLFRLKYIDKPPQASKRMAIKPKIKYPKRLAYFLKESDCRKVFVLDIASFIVAEF
ncbi:hypothetical protein D3C80_874570 [compost metagenome]